MVLRRLKSETWKFGFIKPVDEGRISPVKFLYSEEKIYGKMSWRLLIIRT